MADYDEFDDDEFDAFVAGVDSKLLSQSSSSIQSQAPSQSQTLPSHTQSQTQQQSIPAQQHPNPFAVDSQSSSSIHNDNLGIARGNALPRGASASRSFDDLNAVVSSQPKKMSTMEPRKPLDNLMGDDYEYDDDEDEIGSLPPPAPIEVPLDDVISHIGGFGRTQKEALIVAVCVGILGAMQSLSPMFIATAASANKTVTATGFFEYPSLAVEWHISSSTVSLISSMYFFGWLVGAGLFGWVSDSKWGRRKTMLFCAWWTFVTAFIASVAPTFWLFVILRFLVGVGIGGVELMAFVCLLELSPARLRATLGICLTGSFSFGLLMLVPLSAMLVHRWRALCMLTSLPAAITIVLLTHGWIMESPRWLLSMNLESDARNVLAEMARKNKTELPRASFILIVSDEAKIHSASRPTSAIAIFFKDIKRLLKNGTTCFITFVMVWNWFVSSASYYGFTMFSPQLGGDLYGNAALSALAEVPAFLIALGLLYVTGRRNSFTVTMAIGFIGCVAVAASPDESVRKAFSFIGKLGVSSAFSIVYVYGSELFPTNLRSTGLGMCNQGARIGGILASPITLLGNGGGDVWKPMVVLGVFTFLSCVLSCFLPETKDKPLPESSNDLELASCCSGLSNARRVSDSERELHPNRKRTSRFQRLKDESFEDDDDDDDVLPQRFASQPQDEDDEIFD